MTCFFFILLPITDLVKPVTPPWAKNQIELKTLDTDFCRHDAGGDSRSVRWIINFIDPTTRWCHASVDTGIDSGKPTAG